ncbi:hypothetical protein AVEN_133521-1 [Araneus ventricosus]|uniref:Uncharacterized protein n=1 Tax=Araneus ventricosus TaxID=182803 RepID=A0A4Y2P2S1_ARAVE|nr:hypothetical protein AVEN_133521-1 [Araneus ventricosus]
MKKALSLVPTGVAPERWNETELFGLSESEIRSKSEEIRSSWDWSSCGLFAMIATSSAKAKTLCLLASPCNLLMVGSIAMLNRMPLSGQPCLTQLSMLISSVLVPFVRTWVED